MYVFHLKNFLKNSLDQNLRGRFLRVKVMQHTRTIPLGKSGYAINISIHNLNGNTHSQTETVNKAAIATKHRQPQRVCFGVRASLTA